MRKAIKRIRNIFVKKTKYDIVIFLQDEEKRALNKMMHRVDLFEDGKELVDYLSYTITTTSGADDDYFKNLVTEMLKSNGDIICVYLNDKFYLKKDMHTLSNGMQFTFIDKNKKVII